MTRSAPRVTSPGLNSGNLVRDSALGWVPETLEPLMALQTSLWRESPVAPSLLELLRLRNARAVNCVMCKSVRYDVARQDGLSEDKVETLADYRHSDLLSEAEKLAVEFADVYLQDPRSMTPDLRQRLARCFSPEQVAHMALALASFNAMSKCAVSLGGMPESLPVMELSLDMVLGVPATERFGNA